MLKNEQRKKLFGMAKSLGLLDNGNKYDLLHDLIYSITQKTSIRELTEKEYKKVVAELASQLKVRDLEEDMQGRSKISKGQINKIWLLMYDLEALDEKPSSAQLGDRLCGIIRKELHIDCIPKSPFRWFSYQQASKLIEILKKYVANAQRRKDGGRGKI